MSVPVAVTSKSGDDNDENSIINVMAQYKAFVTAALKPRPGFTDDIIDVLLVTYFIFV